LNKYKNDRNTQELLDIIMKRAFTYATVKYGSEPDYLKSYGDGLYAIFDRSCCGDYIEESELITAANLTEDLDEVSRQREIQLIEEKRLAAIKQQEIEARYEREQKAIRLAEFKKLKREFE